MLPRQVVIGDILKFTLSPFLQDKNTRRINNSRGFSMIVNRGSIESIFTRFTTWPMLYNRRTKHYYHNLLDLRSCHEPNFTN